MVTDLPSNGILEVYIRAQSGASVTFSLPLQASNDLDQNKQSSQNNTDQNTLVSTQPLALGGKWGEFLSLAGKTLNTEFVRPSLQLKTSTNEDINLGLELNPSESEQLSYEIDSWSLIIIEEQESLEVENGQGIPPQNFTWSPLDPISSTQSLGFQIKLTGRLSNNLDQLSRDGQRGQFTVYSPVIGGNESRWNH